MSIVVNSGNTLNIVSGAVYNDVVINGGGRTYVSSGGVLSKAMLNYSGYLNVATGNAYDVTINAGGIVYYNPWSTQWTTSRDKGHVERISSGICLGSITDLVISGDFCAQNAVMSNCVFDIANHGIWLYNTTVLGGIVNSTANVYFNAGCMMSGTLIDHRYLAVQSGATIKDVMIDGGNVVINSGASARDTIVTDGGVLSAGARIDGTILRGGSQVVAMISYYPGYGYGSAFDTVVGSNGVNIVSGGSGCNTVVSSGGMERVNGGSALSTIVRHGGIQQVFGGTAVNTEVYGSQYQSGKYGYISNTHIYSGGSLEILNGSAVGVGLDGGASATVIGALVGNISAADGAVIVLYSDAVISGGAIASGAMLYTVGSLRDLDIYGNLSISSGNLQKLRLQSGAVLTTVSGGSIYCSSITVSSGAVLSISRGSYAGVYIAGGTINNLGLNFNSWCVSDGVLNNFGGSETYTSVFDGGRVTVCTAGIEGGAKISGGVMELRDGSLLSSSYIYSGGTVSAVSGTLDNVVFSGGAILRAGNLKTGGYVYMSSGSVVDFLVSEQTPEDGAIIDNFDKFRGSTDFYITVSVTQAEGTYRLADGVSAFRKTATVATDAGTELGTLTVGGTLVSGDNTYSLSLASNILSLTVASYDPPTPTALASGDLDADGRADIVMTITQVGHGAEGATGAWLIQEDQTAAWGDLSTRNSGWEIFGTGVTAAGKATNDVYVRSDGNVIGAWVTGDDGKVTGWETVGEFDSDTQILGLGDFDGNGQTDLLLRNVNGAVGCCFTGGPTEMTTELKGWNYFQSLGDEWSIVGVGDLNGDGRDDVVLKHDAGFAGSWLTQSDCTMAWADLDTLPEGFAIVGCGDFDGDGTSDVLLKKDNYYGAWIVENGNAKSWMGLGDLGSVTVEQIADFDADGIDDLRIRTAAGDLGAQLVKGADTLEWKYYGSVGPEWTTRLAAI